MKFHVMTVICLMLSACGQASSEATQTSAQEGSPNPFMESEQAAIEADEIAAKAEAAVAASEAAIEASEAAFDSDPVISSGFGRNEPVLQTKSRYDCSVPKTCPMMNSCEEAMYYLNTCGDTARDRDGDGVPCEKICG